MPILIKKLGVLIVIAVSTALLPHSAKTEINPKSGQKNQSSSKEGNVTLANAGDQAVIAEEIANLSNQATIPNLTKALINTTMARKNKKRHYTPKPPTPAPTPTPIPTPIPNPPAPTPLPTPTPTSSKSFIDNFSSNLTLDETGSMSESASPNWWLNSGGIFYNQNGTAKTIQGDLPTSSKWQTEYANSNPSDTDNGLHPQNLFRLVTKTKWQNFRQEAYFKINKDNLSNSSERYNPNGLLLFNRYINGNNLYYTGIRVDGTAIIKKKFNGQYFTLAQTKIFPGTYNHDSNPSLLPHNTWIGLRSELTNNSDGTVNIKLFIDKNRTGNWESLFDIKDNAKSYGPEFRTNY